MGGPPATKDGINDPVGLAGKKKKKTWLCKQVVGRAGGTARKGVDSPISPSRAGASIELPKTKAPQGARQISALRRGAAGEKIEGSSGAVRGAGGGGGVGAARQSWRKVVATWQVLRKASGATSLSTLSGEPSAKAHERRQGMCRALRRKIKCGESHGGSARRQATTRKGLAALTAFQSERQKSPRTKRKPASRTGGAPEKDRGLETTKGTGPTKKDKNNKARRRGLTGPFWWFNAGFRLSGEGPHLPPE